MLVSYHIYEIKHKDKLSIKPKKWNKINLEKCLVYYDSHNNLKILCQYP